MGNDALLADQLARAAATHVGDTALVWLKPAEGGEPACLVAVHHDDELPVPLTGTGGPDALVCAVFESGLPAVLDHADFAGHAGAIHPGLSPIVDRGSAAVILPPCGLLREPSRHVGIPCYCAGLSPSRRSRSLLLRRGGRS